VSLKCLRRSLHLWLHAALVRSSIFPAATTSAAKVKAMAIALERVKGISTQQEWFRALGLSLMEVADERKPMSLATVYRAGLAYREQMDPDEAWTSMAKALVSAECIAWLDPIVRTAPSVEAALLRLGRDVDDGLSIRVERSTEGPVRTSGGRKFLSIKVTIDHEPGLEKNGILANVREAEAMAVLHYFGERGEAQHQGTELQLSWASSPPVMLRVITTVLPIALIALGLTIAPRWLVLAGTVQLAIGIAAIVLHHRALKTRTEASMQNRGVLLERVMQLRDAAPNDQNVGDFSGQVIAGRYRVLKRLGTGGSGAVYEAIRTDDDVHVAVKLLRAGAAHDGVSSDRLRREAEALGLAWHPNVVEVYDHGRLPDGTSYMVMELLKGETLQERLDRSGVLDEAALRSVLEALLKALMAIHAAGIVHRDVKPDNVFLLADGSVKVFDFGISRVEWEEMRLTGKGTPLGTPGYVAPEQALGLELDARADLYGVAMLAYVALTGNAPTDAPRVWKQTTAPLVALFEQGLAPEPSARPETARMFLDQFKSALAALV
jgi:Protein kinase domain